MVRQSDKRSVIHRDENRIALCRNGKPFSSIRLNISDYHLLQFPLGITHPTKRQGHSLQHRHDSAKVGRNALCYQTSETDSQGSTTCHRAS